MSNCSILRIGPVGCETAATLRSAIASHYCHHDSSLARASSTDNPSSNNNDLLTISNRYFDANVILAPLGESESIGGDGEDNEEDGILLIFDSTPSSFDILSHHHATAIQDGQDGELLRLCIGATHGPSPLSDGSKKSEEEYSRRVLWCLDRGYEYVEVDLTPEGMKRGFDDRDKDGFARVVEAIGTCMWSSRVMKQRRNVGGGLAAAVAKLSSNDGPKTMAADIMPNNESEKETATTTKPLPVNDSEREKAAMDRLMQDVNNDDDNDQPSETDNNNQNKEPQQQQAQDHQQDEMAFSQLESVLSEAKKIREASTSNCMSDEERRERAGDTAMKLMGLLDSLGLNEGDDTDDGGCDSSDDEQ